MTLAWQRLRHFIVHHILHLDDTPHRIALGVAIGLFVALTPTCGVQMLIGAVLAWLLRANKAPAIALTWVSNVFTTPPLFYFNWCVGHALLVRKIRHDVDVRNQIADVVADVGGFWHLMDHFLDWSFWMRLLAPLRGIAAELIVGSLLVAAVVGLSGYLLTYEGVRRYRERRLARQHLCEALESSPGTVPHETSVIPTRNSA